jgi:hypothetical protein
MEEDLILLHLLAALDHLEVHHPFADRVLRGRRRLPVRALQRG